MRKTQKQAATKTSGPSLVIPDGISRDLEPELLLLDPHNLRLFELPHGMANTGAKLIGQKPVQDKVFKTILDYPRFDIKALEQSIAYNGFLKHEHLIVARYDAQKFLVLEGNRRLTAVRDLYRTLGQELKGLNPNVRNSLRTLPCFVLNGPIIAGSQKTLDDYRHTSEIYIGMRHLMGPKDWEPASRYEFQARLIDDEGWSASDVATRFGRKKYEVERDFKAQRLYRDLRKFESKGGISHSFTYNAFAEAARAPSIMKWLGWSSAKMGFTKKDREESFFHYLISRLEVTAGAGDEGEEESADEAAETIVRRIRDMLKLGDADIDEALEAKDFNSADLFFKERREGDFAKRIANYTRALRTVQMDELSDNPRENRKKIMQLIEQSKKTLILLDALLVR
jgi:hypothetical protein